ncbi:MAG TPA: hypothetical protein VG820_03320 [Fimbriimonadaceae bacterium]|nr:hypothetical protein [Fimbriimonadaceae bacterium]
MTFESMGPAEFGVSPTNGFLPDRDPLHRLPSSFDVWEDLALDLPKKLMSDRFRQLVEALPPFPIEALGNEQEVERAMVLLSYVGHAYVWCESTPAQRLPAVLAVPWHAVAERVGRPPVLSYASYCLHNWKRIDPARGLEVGNIALLQNFLAGQDEEWFVLIHVDIEAKAAPAMAVLLEAQRQASEGDIEGLERQLETIAATLQGMNETMDRMPEKCDPYIYFHRVRPYIHGWRNHPDLPEGVVYEGVPEYGGKPQTFRGETGAQSGIVPALDAFLGVDHAPDELRSYLSEMRLYMPPGHRRFVEELEQGSSVRDFVQGHSGPVKDLYDLCVRGLDRFRTTHLEYAARYIYMQAQTDPKNPHAVGTGGTPFMPYLKKHRDETRHSVLGK